LRGAWNSASIPRPSKKEALRNLREAVELYLEDLPATAKIVPTEVTRFKVAV
jgi:predicted RNase H-like HicB family nuclease